MQQAPHAEQSGPFGAEDKKLLQIIDIGCIRGLLYPNPNPGGFDVTLLRSQTILVCVLLILNFLSVQASSPPKKKKKKFRGSDKCAATLVKCDQQFNGDGCLKSGNENDFDPKLNVQKNRTDIATSFRDVTYADMIRMKEPANWTRGADRTDLQTKLVDGTVITEGTPIRVYGYLNVARREGAESCNCKLDAEGEPGQYLTDVHLAITDKKSTPETRSFTAEITPRFRAMANNPKELIWSSIQNYKGLFVRVSGYLVLDTEHLHSSPPKRKKSWEVHPVVKFEVCAVKAQNCAPTGTAGWRTIK
jgi:hypothetical protein